LSDVAAFLMNLLLDDASLGGGDFFFFRSLQFLFTEVLGVSRLILFQCRNDRSVRFVIL